MFFLMLLFAVLSGFSCLFSKISSRIQPHRCCLQGSARFLGAGSSSRKGLRGHSWQRYLGKCCKQTAKQISNFQKLSDFTEFPVTIKNVEWQKYISVKPKVNNRWVSSYDFNPCLISWRLRMILAYRYTYIMLSYTLVRTHTVHSVFCSK